MEVAPSVGGIKFFSIDVDIALDKFVGEIKKFMKERKQEKQEPWIKLVNDLSAAETIVRKLTKTYIDSMLAFGNEQIVSDKDSLKTTIEEAKRYLGARDLYPGLVELTNHIQGEMPNAEFKPAGAWLYAVWLSLTQFLQSLQPPPEQGQPALTGVGWMQLCETIGRASELLERVEEKSVQAGDFKKFADQAFWSTFASTNLTASSAVSAAVGRATAALKHSH